MNNYRTLRALLALILTILFTLQPVKQSAVYASSIPSLIPADAVRGEPAAPACNETRSQTTLTGDLAAKITLTISPGCGTVVIGTILLITISIEGMPSGPAPTGMGRLDMGNGIGGYSTICLFNIYGNTTFHCAYTPPFLGLNTIVAVYVGDENYQEIATPEMYVSVVNFNKGTATVNLSSLEQPFTGQPHAVTATTIPAGLPVSITYNGSTELPVDAGRYEVAAQVNTTDYWGCGTGTLVITKALSTIDVITSPPDAIYNQPVTFLATVADNLAGAPDPGGSVTFTIGNTVLDPVALVNGEARVTFTPSSTGSVAYTAGYNPDGNHEASSAHGSLTVGIANARVTLTNFSMVYDGKPHGVTVTTDPPALEVTLTYNGETAPPVNAGTYKVEAVIDETGYSGRTSAVLVIDKAPLKVIVDPASRPFGTPNPAIPYHFEDFVNGEGNSAVSGTPVFSPLPALDALPDLYTIGIVKDSLTSKNYDLKLTPGVLTITPASTHLSLSMTPNQASAGQPVTLKAKVTSDAGELPEGVRFEGYAYFSIDGGVEVPVPLSADGTAAYRVTAMPPDQLSVSVRYPGDARFNRSSRGPVEFLTTWLRFFIPVVAQ